MTTLRRALFGLLTLALVTLGIAGPASALNPVPVPWTPQLVTAGSHAQKFIQCGTSAYIVGDFAQVRQPGGPALNHFGVFKFDAATGVISTWDPHVVGKEVHGIAASYDCTTIYLGGDFTTVGGQPAANLAAVSATTGVLITTFAHSTNGMVNTVMRAPGNLHLLVGGKFTVINGVSRSYLASLNLATGAVDSWVNVPISGTYGPEFPTQVYDMKASHGYTRILINGVFTRVGPDLGGRTTHTQVFILNISIAATSVSVWDSPEFHVHADMACAGTGTKFYAKGIAWGTGEEILIASTGWRAYPGAYFCDSLVRFPSTASYLNKSDFDNNTCADSLYSVLAYYDPLTKTWPYLVGGHQRWVNVPEASLTTDICNSGANPGGASAYRPGISAIDRYTKVATAWNPTTSRGHGIEDIEQVGYNVWFLGDANQIGNVDHFGIAEFVP